jgi:uncharacterized cofD-like protein
MMDSGSSSGRLRDEFGYLPPGDVRQCLVALSDAPQELRNLMEYRFQTEGSLGGHVVGNILLTALKDLHAGDEYAAIKSMESIMRIRGSVYPVTITNSHLVATLEDGTVILGEGNLYYGQDRTDSPIMSLTLEPKASLFAPTRKVLTSADYILIGPGTLNSSILPNLIVDGMVDCLRQAKTNGAKIIFVVNIMTKYRDSDGFAASDFLNKVQSELDGVKIDAVIVNNSEFPQDQLIAYSQEKAYPVPCDLSGEDQLVVAEDFVPEKLFLKSGGRASFARHDPKKLAKAVVRTIGLLKSSD